MIKVRGFSKKFNKFIYGFKVFKTNNKTYIVSQTSVNSLNVSTFEVDENSTGQYIGLKDCEYAEIYEGDVVIVSLKRYIVFSDKCKFKLKNIDEGGITGINLIKGSNAKPKIIGNVYEKPEFML